MRTMKIRLLLPLLVVVLLPVHSVRAQIDVRLTKAAAPAVAPLTASGAADGATFIPLSLRTVGEFGGRIQNVAVSSDGNFAYVGMEQTVAVIDLNQNPEPAQLGVTRILGGLVIDVAVNGHTVYAVVYSGGLYAIDAADPANPTVVGFYPSPAARGVDVVGNLAYLSSAGLTILDVSQPGHPVAVGVLPIPEYVLGVTVSGHYAYVATQGSLRILDVANPASPFEVGSVAVEGARATAVMNGFAYVVQIEDGFAVVNVNNPAAPAVVGQVALPGYTYDISVLGQHLFVAGERHLRTFDVTTPSQPTATGIYYTRQEPVSLAVRNNVVYVAALSAGLHIVDATDLLMMREVGRQDTPGQASGIALAGSHAYVADGAQGLRILSLTSPAQPHEVGFYDTPGFAENVAVVGTRAYIADGRNPDTWQVSGLRIIDVSNPAHPTELGSIQTPDDANDVFVVGALVYVAARESGLRIIDAANPASPQEIGFVDTPGDAVAVAVTTQPSGTYALVADTIYGVRIIDVSNPAQPQEISHLPQNLGGEWNSVVVRGNYAYVTESYWQWDGLYVMDISDPSAPEFVGFAPAERALGVMLVGDHAYVGGSQLTVFDLADPVRPIELGAYESSGRVAVQQALAYQAAGNDGVRVVDVQNLSTPVRAGNLVNGTVVDVAKTGAYGLITGDASLRVLNLADAQHPQLVGRLATTTPTNRIVVSGSYAYATQRAVLDHNLNAWTGGGLRIVNVSNPLAPAGRGFFATPDGSGLGPVAVAGHYVYAVSIDIFTPGADFYAIDVANPDAPMQVGRYSVPAGITNMAVKGPYAYLLTESGTLRIIGLANPAQLVEVGSLAIPSDATSLAVTDHYVIIGFDSSDGLHIVDVANPAAPSLVRTLTAIGGIEAMSIHGHNLYTARFANIAMVDLSNPLRPLASAYRSVPASQDRASIVAVGDTVYLPQDTDGLLIFKTTPLTRSLNLPLIVGSF